MKHHVKLLHNWVKKSIVQIPQQMPDAVNTSHSIVVAQPQNLSTRERALAPGYAWGWLPALSVFAASGLFVVAFAFTGSRDAHTWAEPLFWLGLLMIVVPITARLVTVRATPRERFGLVVLLGMTLFLVRVVYNPIAFTFPDELTHYRNTFEVLQNNSLFQENPGVPATARYPGLQTITSAIVSVTGLPIFWSGIVVIGSARFILIVALYHLHKQITSSDRVAGLAAAIYIGNTNFVFWSAQFAYESLALPLALFVLVAVWYKGQADADNYTNAVAWRVVAILGILAVVATHHMTSFALAALLVLLTGLHWFLVRKRQASPQDLAVVAFVAAYIWLVFMANVTIEYLSPVLGGAIRGVTGLLTGEGQSRELFKSSSTGYVAPLWERFVGLGSVGLLTLVFPFGLWQIWRNFRTSLFALMLTGIALLYFPLLALRLTPAGWETSNRTSAFLYIGLSLIMALGLVYIWPFLRFHRFKLPLLTTYIAIVFMGGLIAGWPPKVRLSKPYVVDSGMHQIEPQGVFTAKWTRDFLGPDNPVAVDAANAKFVLAYGEQIPYTRSKYGIRSMFYSDNIGQTERNIIRRTGVQYIIFDRRLISWDHMAGLYFDHTDDTINPGTTFLDPDAYRKFDTQESVDRIYDSGNIVIYDVGIYSHAASAR